MNKAMKAPEIPQDFRELAAQEVVWLVLAVDDFMDGADPMGIADRRHRPHEYSPELPDLINLIVNDSVTIQAIDGVFKEYFGHPLGPNAVSTTAELVEGLSNIRLEWLAYREQLSTTV